MSLLMASMVPALHAEEKIVFVLMIGKGEGHGFVINVELVMVWRW
jgi:hypothetical protein